MHYRVGDFLAYRGNAMRGIAPWSIAAAVRSFYPAPNEVGASYRSARGGRTRLAALAAWMALRKSRMNALKARTGVAPLLSML